MAFTSGVSKKGQNVSRRGWNKSYFENARNFQDQCGNRNWPMSHEPLHCHPALSPRQQPGSQKVAGKAIVVNLNIKSGGPISKRSARQGREQKPQGWPKTLNKFLLVGGTERSDLWEGDRSVQQPDDSHGQLGKAPNSVMCKLCGLAQVSQAWLIPRAPPTAGAGYSCYCHDSLLTCTLIKKAVSRRTVSLSTHTYTWLVLNEHTHKGKNSPTGTLARANRNTLVDAPRMR